MACTLESSPEWLNPPVARGWTLSTRPLMNAETDKMRATLADQLASFDDKLATKADEVEMLAEIQRGIGRLLSAAGGEEAEIRRMLQERYESGELRKETFQLVKSILDRYVTEQIPTEAQDSPDETDGDGDGAAADAAADDTGMPAERRGAASASDDGDDGFSSTTVIDEPVSAADDADDRVQVGSVLRDRFLLQEKIAGGSMGVVYKALDRRLAEAGADQAHVAIKILSPQLAQSGPALRALQQEAAKGRNLNHPNIVRFIDFDRDDDLYFIVMEWMPGRTLADILDSSDASGIDHDRARAIVRDVGKALVYAHRCGIVHADVKPANVMILPDGSAKLFDFGVARVRQKQAEDDRFDPGVPGAMTPAYSSMQVLTGEEPVPTDDVFALGCLYYRLIAGHRVFGPRNAAEAAEEGMKPQQPAGLADREWKAIRKALSFARVTRFETMQEFLDALAAPDELTVRADDRRSQPTDTGAPGGKGWILALAVVAIAAGSGYVTWQQGWIPELAPRPGAADQPALDAVVVAVMDQHLLVARGGDPFDRLADHGLGDLVGAEFLCTGLEGHLHPRHLRRRDRRQRRKAGGAGERAFECHRLSSYLLLRPGRLTRLQCASLDQIPTLAAKCASQRIQVQGAVIGRLTLRRGKIDDE